MAADIGVTTTDVVLLFVLIVVVVVLLIVDDVEVLSSSDIARHAKLVSNFPEMKIPSQTLQQYPRMMAKLCENGSRSGKKRGVLLRCVLVGPARMQQARFTPAVPFLPVSLNRVL